MKYFCLVCNKELNCFRSKIKNFCSKECRHSEKGKNLSAEKRKQTNLKKYGVEHNSQSEVIKEKKKQTSLDHFGTEHPNQCCEVKNKIKQTNLKKYGHESVLQSEDVIKKKIFTWQQKYGVDNPLKSGIIQNKIKQTNLEKYGVENPSQSKIIKQKKINTTLNNYGVAHHFQSTKIQSKIKQTNLEKYGVEYLQQSREIIEKIKNIRKKDYYNNHLLNFKIVKPLFSLEEYRGNKIQEYSWKCLKCGSQFKSIMANGRIPRCLKCFPYLSKSGISKIEKEILNWLLSAQITAYKKKFKRKYEIDIYIPDKNIGIELNGIYWHSENGGNKSASYHLEKSEYFAKMGIQIIHIWDSEWINQQELIKSIILAKLGLILNKIFARKCQIKELSHKDSEKFLNENHIQRSVISKTRLGLFYNNELVSILTLGSPRFDRKYQWEIYRYCNKKYTRVIGGFSKLWKYFLKTYQPSDGVLTYADRRFSNGRIYADNGFQLIKTTFPNYFYTKDYHNLENRMKYQKYKLKHFSNYDAKLSEWEIMQLEGFDRVYDCGNLVFSYMFPKKSIILSNSV